MTRRAQWGIGLVIAAVALIEPCMHFYLEHGLPEEVAATGLHIPDDAFLLPCLNAGSNGWFSPYLTCKHPGGTHDFKVYSLPHYWLYRAVGDAGRFLYLSPFMALGLANGLGAAFYLWAVYRFMRAALPRVANTAFVLFVLGGGCGGMLYLLTGLAGLHAQPGFESFFHRYARYELIEGPFLSPLLLVYRLYYTLPLGLGFMALASCCTPNPGSEVRVCRCSSVSSQRWWATLLVFAASLLNARLGPLFWGAAVALSFAKDGLSRRTLWVACVWGIPVLLATAFVGGMMRLHPMSAQNIAELLRRSMGFGSFLSVTVFFLLAAAPIFASTLRTANGPSRLFLFPLIGYLFAFTLGYALYQTYYGNWLRAGDASAAIAVSDKALIGVVVGLLVAWRWRLNSPPHDPSVSVRVRPCSPEDTLSQGLVLWFLGLTAVAVSAFGQGWFLRLMPERCMVLLGVPLALLAALGLEEWKHRAPRFSRALLGLLLAGGLISGLVGVLVIQGPLGSARTGTFRWCHSESLARAEAEVIAHIDGGTVLAPASLPPLYSDIIVSLRPGVTTPLGQATLSLGDVNVLQMTEAIQRWFAPEGAEADRKALVDKYCIDYVFCPEWRPVAPETLAQFRQTPWLREVAQSGGAVLFRVNRTPETTP